MLFLHVLLLPFKHLDCGGFHIILTNLQTVHLLWQGESNVYTTGYIGSHKVVSTKIPAFGRQMAAQISSGNTTTRLLGRYLKHHSLNIIIKFSNAMITLWCTTITIETIPGYSSVLFKCNRCVLICMHILLCFYMTSVYVFMHIYVFIIIIYRSVLL